LLLAAGFLHPDLPSWDCPSVRVGARSVPEGARIEGSPTVTSTANGLCAGGRQATQSPKRPPKQSFWPDWDHNRRMSLCCDMMQGQVDTRCADHPDPFDCPDNLIFYSPQTHEFGLIVHDGGSSYIAIQHCPWCGAGLEEAEPA
jgi:hypothetical protein